MDIARIRRELFDAKKNFALVELRVTTEGKVYARAALQTVNGHSYVLSIKFPDTYPNEMPSVFIDAPAIPDAPHRWKAGNICYLHPSMWNPGAHNLGFVIWRSAKWLNKYEVWRNNDGTWPGAEFEH